MYLNLSLCYPSMYMFDVLTWCTTNFGSPARRQSYRTLATYIYYSLESTPAKSRTVRSIGYISLNPQQSKHASSVVLLSSSHKILVFLSLLVADSGISLCFSVNQNAFTVVCLLVSKHGWNTRTHTAKTHEFNIILRNQRQKDPARTLV